MRVREMTDQEQWEALSEIPKLEPITTRCRPFAEPSQDMMKAALGIGPQTGKRSWEYILPPAKEEMQHGDN